MINKAETREEFFNFALILPQIVRKDQMEVLKEFNPMMRNIMEMLSEESED